MPAISIKTLALVSPDAALDGEYQLPSRTRHTRRAVAHGYRLVRDGSASPEYSARTPIRAPRDVARLMAPVAAVEPTEVFWILPLNAQHQLQKGGYVAITRGIVNSSLVHAREVFLAAIVAQASAIILCHNHPSGMVEPSAEDQQLTRELEKAGRLLGIPVLDHIIIGAGEKYMSFTERGLID